MSTPPASTPPATTPSGDDGADPAILARVPHRPPMLLLHRLLACDATGARASGPDAGVVPWPLAAIEGIAQTAALLGERSAAVSDGAAGRLVGVRRCVGHASPRPGGEVVYSVAAQRRVGATLLVQGRAECDGTLLAEADLVLWMPRGPA